MPPPNVVCVSIDSVRADCCSAVHPEANPTTPFLESIAPESAAYTAAISPSTWTLPVHTSVFTGLYPPEHGVIDKEAVLGAHPTFAELLAERGYSTDAFYALSWFEVGDVLRGFSDRGGPGDPNDVSSRKEIVERIGERSPLAERFLLWMYSVQRRYRELAGRSLTVYREWDRRDGDDPAGIGTAFSWLGGQATIDGAIEAAETVEEPFCWFVHLNEAHWKYTPPGPYHRLYSDRSVPSLVHNWVRYQERIHGSLSNRLAANAGERSIPDAEIDTMADLYRGAIRYCDAAIERLVDGLREQGLWENTVLIVFGDHGDAFGEGGDPVGENGIFGHHWTVDESVVRVPLVVRDPTGTVDTGRVTDPVSLVDVYPTILDITDTEGPPTRGESLADRTREFAYTYYEAPPHCTREAEQLGLSDRLPPSEQHLVWQSPSSKFVFCPGTGEMAGDESLKPTLQTHTESLVEVGAGSGDVGDDVADRLRSIGYLE